LPSGRPPPRFSSTHVTDRPHGRGAVEFNVVIANDRITTVKAGDAAKIQGGTREVDASAIC
jgi:hypothetical protein